MENSKTLPNIRIRKIVLENFRNIEHAEVDIPGGKLSEFLNGDSSILGIYGQNGSGKTSLLIAIYALKTALCGGEFIYAEFASCIRAGCDHSHLEFEMSAYNEVGTEYEFYYSFNLSINNSDEKNKIDSTEIDEAMEFIGFDKILSEKGKDALAEYLRPQGKKIVVSDELLQFASKSQDGKKNSKQVLIDTSEKACKSSGKTFGNKSKYEQLTLNADADTEESLYRAKIESNIKSTSFIFSPTVFKTLYKSCGNDIYRQILRSLSEYGNNYLFVIMMAETAQNNIKLLPLSLWINDPKSGAFGLVLPLKLYDHCKIPVEIFPQLEDSIESISNVVSKIVPGLAIKTNSIGTTMSENGNEVQLFDLVSVRNGVPLPLIYESDGIRRIISFMSFFIAAYNNPSFTVAIDEIDSGIFEYMLGELLSIMKDSAKGQLIFTSHNLRPLEVLPYKNLLFTTINPNRRFSKLDGISGNNNLRDSYFRSIILGDGENAFYDSTDSFNIEQSLFEAGLPKED